MEIHENNVLPQLKKTVVTVGFFDGVHRGHRQVLSILTGLAKTYSSPSVVITFWPHPRWITENSSKPELLSTPDEKKRLISQCGVDHLIIFPFNRQFAELPAKEFILHYLVEPLKPSHLVIGHDHHFGHERAGDQSLLEKIARDYGFTLHTVPAAADRTDTISSTKIRAALARGDVEQAARWLDAPYTLTATVTEGMKIGRQLGFPTANLVPSENYKVIPPDGVYLVKAENSRFSEYGLLNIGRNPSIAEKKMEHTIELHIFNICDNLYHNTITVHFLTRLRDELQFGSKEELIRQIGEDKAWAIEWIRKNRLF